MSLGESATAAKMDIKGKDETDLDSIISAPDFRLVTTLQYLFPSDHDGHDASDTSHTVESRALVKQWRVINIKLLELHTRRLRESAQALGWTDVDKNLFS